MSIQAILAGVYGAEDLGEAEVVATAEQAAEAVIDSEIKEIELEVSEAVADVTENTNAIEALEDAVEELEEKVEGMESLMNGKEPWNPGLFAERYKDATKIAAKLGNTKIDVLGAESLADENTALLTTVNGMESFKETAKKAGGAIKAFFIGLYNGVINWMHGLFNGFVAKKTKAESLIKRIEGEKFKTKEKYSEGKWAAYLSGDKENTLLASTINSVQAAAVAVLAKENPAELVAGVKSGVDALAKFGQSSVTSTNELNETLTVKFGNGVKIMIVSPKAADKQMDKSLNKVSVKSAIGEYTPKKDQAGLSVQDMKAILTAVKSDCDKLRYTKADGKALTAARDHTISKLERDGARKDSDGKKDTAYAISCVKGAHKGALALLTGATDLASKIINARLALVAANS